MNSLTQKEALAVADMQRAFQGLAKHKSLAIYVLDDMAIVCKLGVPSSEISETVGRGLRPCCVLTDIHDDMDCGRK